MKRVVLTLTVTKKLRRFTENAPGSPYYWKFTVLYSLGSLHTDSSFLKAGTPGTKVSWVLQLRLKFDEMNYCLLACILM